MISIVICVNLKNEETGQSLELCFDKVEVEGELTREQSAVIGTELSRDLRILVGGVKANGETEHPEVKLRGSIDIMQDLREGLKRDKARTPRRPR